MNRSQLATNTKRRKNIVKEVEIEYSIQSKEDL